MLKIPKCPRCQGAMSVSDKSAGVIYGSCLMCSREYILDKPLDGTDLMQVRPIEPSPLQKEPVGKRYQRSKAKGTGL